jgi:hypothetical protein
MFRIRYLLASRIRIEYSLELIRILPFHAKTRIKAGLGPKLTGYGKQEEEKQLPF